MGWEWVPGLGGGGDDLGDEVYLLSQAQACIYKVLLVASKKPQYCKVKIK